MHGTADGWAHDVMGSGTHAAGVIAGADTGKGVIGIAVDPSRRCASDARRALSAT